jgi:HAD superfamily hydrolase (TIGR01509 family)
MLTINTEKYKAFLFDLNGTMIHDMPYHVNAWHKVVQNLGGTLSESEMKAQCYGKGEEMLERIFPGKFTLQERINISVTKEDRYRIEFLPELKLIEGLDELLTRANQHQIKLGIGSAANNLNIDFVVDNLNLSSLLQAIISGEMVSESKPHPETFLKCAELLAIPVRQCLVFEDTPKGVACAANAGMDVVVLTTTHPKSDFEDFKNIIHFADDYKDIELSIHLSK